MPRQNRRVERTVDSVSGDIVPVFGFAVIEKLYRVRYMLQGRRVVLESIKQLRLCTSLDVGACWR